MSLCKWNLFVKTTRILILFCLLTATGLANEGLKEPLTIEKVTAYLNAHPEITSIDEFLSHLPENFCYRRALGFKSRSRQGASPTAPRIIMLAKDPSFAMAITGRSDQLNGEDIEMVQFKGDAKTPW